MEQQLQNSYKSYSRSLLVLGIKGKTKARRLPSLIITHRLTHLRIKPPLDPVTVVLLRGGAEAEVEVGVKAAEMDRHRASPFVTTVVTPTSLDNVMHSRFYSR